MGLLADTYSYGDTLKRKVKGLLADPRGTLEQFVGQLGDDTNTNISNMQTGYGIGGNKSVLVSSAQKVAAQQALADYGAQSGMAAATVWHGSPHKFDKFDASKIGTGEGAQAYGHGLYLAEAPDVAAQYRKQLSPSVAINSKGVDSSLIHGANSFKESGYSFDDALVGMKGAYKNSNPKDIEAAAMKAYGQEYGSLYKVDLPDEHIAKMLDWDKPLSQQPQNVQQALSPKVVQRDGGWFVDSGPKRGSWKFSSEAEAASEARQAAMSRDLTGNVLHDSLKTGADADTAKMLRELGIPGIRYLDGGSRGAGAGSSNFVVFPGKEDILKILERNGQGLLGQ